MQGTMVDAGLWEIRTTSERRDGGERKQKLGRNGAADSSRAIRLLPGSSELSHELIA